MSRNLLFLGMMATVAGIAGCDAENDTIYGRVHGKSLNGTSVLADILRDQGHSVRVAVRLTDDLGENVDTLIRFAPYPGPPDAREAAWYADWLQADSDRRLLYVVRDYDATPEYWSEVLKGLPQAEDNPDRIRAARLRDRARIRPNWICPPPKSR